MSFEERSVWIQLISLFLAFAGYFYVAIRMWYHGVTELSAYLSVFAVTVVLLAIAMGVVHAMMAIFSGSGGRNERDPLVGYRAGGHSGWLLAIGLICGIETMIMSLPVIWTVHLLLVTLFLSEVMKLATQLVYYRRCRLAQA